jgi:hypothetical protein
MAPIVTFLASAVIAALGLIGLATPGASAGDAKPDASQTAGASGGESGLEAAPGLLLVETEAKPRITVAWIDTDGERHELAGERAYAAAGDRSPLGGEHLLLRGTGGGRV